MRAPALWLSAGLLALAACSPTAETPVADPGPEGAPTAVVTEGVPAAGATVSGAASWSGLEAPDTARLIVEIRDATRTPDVNDLVLQQEFPAGDSPVAFTLELAPEQLREGSDFVLRARLQDGYAILLASDGNIDVAESGETAGLDVPLYDPEELARSGPRPMITPGGTAYTCGGEALTIAVEAGAAYVIFADGNAVKLDKLEGANGGAVQFTNDRFLVEQTGEDLRYGRGRAATQPCTPAG